MAKKKKHKHRLLNSDFFPTTGDEHAIEIDSKNEISQAKNDSFDRSIERPIDNPNLMEIHHPHGTHHERKLKDYLFEFLMLFVAVTAGFFAENLRENHVERKKEKEYIHSIVNDIQEDTTNIGRILIENTKQLKGIDTVLTLLENQLSSDKYFDFYHLSSLYLSQYRNFNVRNITISQLKNSGTMRLIENKLVSDSIIFYYSNFDEYSKQLEFNMNFFQKIIELEIGFMDYSVARNKNRKLSIGPKYNNQEFYNHIIIIYSLIINENNWLESYKLQGTSLLRFLQKEYNL